MLPESIRTEVVYALAFLWHVLCAWAVGTAFLFGYWMTDPVAGEIDGGFRGTPSGDSQSSMAVVSAGFVFLVMSFGGVFVIRRPFHPTDCVKSLALCAGVSVLVSMVALGMGSPVGLTGWRDYLVMASAGGLLGGSAVLFALLADWIEIKETRKNWKHRE